MFSRKHLFTRVIMTLLMLPLMASLSFTAVTAAEPAASTLVFHPTADALVKRRYPNRNFGAAGTLQARGGKRIRSYLRFSVSGLGGQQVTKARLLLYAMSSSPNPIRIRPVPDNSWGEMTLTFNNAPAMAPAVSAAPSITAGQWVGLNVTSYVKGDGTYSFAVVTPGADMHKFASRESGAHAPRLVLTVGAGTTTTSSVKHVFVIVMENKGYSQVWNKSNTPFTTQLGNNGAVSNNYHAITHPSLPNYLNMYAGSNFGITTDCSPSSNCHSNASTLADNLEAKGLKWKAYMESMPAPCYLTASSTYAPKHNPFVYFDDIRSNSTRCKSHVVPFSELSGDLVSLSTTPNFAFISPNLCSDTHDCSISTGDNWLKSHVPTILNSAACKVDKCLLILTWDEDDGGTGNHVLTVFAGSGAKTGYTTATSYTHYSLLKTVEYIFGLPTQTSHDANASPMKDMLR